MVLFQPTWVCTIFLICIISVLVETVTSSCRTMFEDALDDFYEVDLIKSRFEAWRNEQTESYDEAYIGLCLPKLFTPLVRLGLVTWNPLKVKNMGSVMPKGSLSWSYCHTKRKEKERRVEKNLQSW